MTYDFRASQVRTNKIISSGSTGTNAALLIYPFASALNQSGSINTAVFATGSIGSDVFLFVSGAVNSMGTSTQGTTLFGGDLKVSGAFMTLNSIQSYGSVIAYSTFSAFQSASFLSDATIFGGNYVSGPFIAYSTSRLVGATTRLLENVATPLKEAELTEAMVPEKVVAPVHRKVLEPVTGPAKEAVETAFKVEEKVVAPLNKAVFDAVTGPLKEAVLMEVIAPEIVVAPTDPLTCKQVRSLISNTMSCCTCVMLCTTKLVQFIAVVSFFNLRS
jgi:uncharacterized membrane protein